MDENKDLKLPSRSIKEIASIKFDQIRDAWDYFRYGNGNGNRNLILELTGYPTVARYLSGNPDNIDASEALMAIAIPGEAAIKNAAVDLKKPLKLFSFESEKIVPNVGRGVKKITMQDIIDAIKNNGKITYEGTTPEEIKSIGIRQQANNKANYNTIILKQDKQDSAIKDLWDRQRGNYVKRLPREIIGTGPELTSQINVEKYYSYKPSISPEANLRKFKERMKTDFSFTDKSIEEVFNNTYSKYFNLRKQGGSVNYIDYCKNGSGIHIKKKNKGKFTDYCGGKVTAECIAKGKNSPSATIRKRATFAANARTWKHQSGGRVFFNAAENKYKPEFNNEVVLKGGSDEEVIQYASQSQTPEQSSSNWARDLITLLRSEEAPGQTSESVVQQAAESSALRLSESSKSVDSDAATRMKTAVDYLVSKGLTRAGAAGAVGVFFAESGLKPGVVNEAAAKKDPIRADKGIAQWQGDRRITYDAYMIGRQGTLEDELDYFLEDVASRPKVLEVLKNTSSVDEAVKAMHLGYENGTTMAFATPELLTEMYTKAFAQYGYGKYSYQDSHNKRLKYAQTAYNLV